MLALAVVLFVASAMLSASALVLVGLRETLESHLGGSEGVLVVYDPGSRAPYTGSVPAQLAARLASVEGVLASSPEVVVPCVIGGRAVFVRGVVPEELSKVDELEVVEGDPIGFADAGSALVGREAARRLGLAVGDPVLVLGVLSPRYAELRVRGIFESGTALDSEVLVPLYVAQWLGGLGYGRVNLVRLRLDPRADPSAVAEAVRSELLQLGEPSAEPEGLTPLEVLVLWAAVRYGRAAVEEVRRLAEAYVGRYGVTREAVLTVSVAVMLFSCLAVVAASRALVSEHRSELAVLRSLGASRRLLRVDMFLRLLPWAAASSLLGALAASLYLTLARDLGLLLVLSHAMVLRLDPSVVAIGTACSVALAALGVLGCDVP